MSASRPNSPIPDGPLPIRRLDEALVNRIAAGEIIHRPSSALKELLENALDARSTQIKVTIKDGGLKLLQIADNGTGIRKSDLPILCERFTTSKLSEYSDLQAIATFGFRGEALASISHVAHLSIVTKTKDDTCAWRACYADGGLVPPKPGLTSDPRPCAGNDGTTITVEDLFYNTPTRLSALRSSSDEYGRILDVVTRYAVHNPKVSFTCKKAGFAAPEVSTPSSSSVQATIKLLYGATVARELLHVSASSVTGAAHGSKGKGKARDDDPEWEAEAYVTNANYQAKKTTLLLFINHRLVESSKIKRALEAAYGNITAKGACPFVYLSLQIAPNQVDVNVHPTKREVHFMNEEEIISAVVNAIEKKVLSLGESRTFEYQTLLTGGVAGAGEGSGSKQKDVSKAKRKTRDDEPDDDDEDDVRELPSTSKIGVKKPAPQHKVRTSMSDRTLDSMFTIGDPTQSPNIESSDAGKGRTREDIAESVCALKSIQELRAVVAKRRHGGLTDILQSHTFVGIADMRLTLSLVQHTTKLFLLNHGVLAEELFHQLGLRQFGQFERVKLNPPPPIRALIKLAVDAEGDEVLKSGMKPDAVVEMIVALLTSQTEMLDECFAMTINAQCELETLPLLLKEYTPNLDHLPQFLMRLGPEVDWTAEGPCFDAILRELAYLYRPGPVGGIFDAEGTHPSAAPDPPKVSPEEKAQRWQIQHVVFPALRKYLVPHKALLEGDCVVQVANLPDLYRVFERC